MASGKDVETVRVYAGAGTPDGAPTASLRVDALGLQCPLPVLKLQKALRTLGPGKTVRLDATDPASRIDVPHFCNESGHNLQQQTEADGVLSYWVTASA